jgi:diguanylate cyclase (GGDEF)-like protein
MSGPQQPAREPHNPADVVQRYLRDARDSVAVDSVIFLRVGAQNQLEPYAWSSDGPPDTTPLQREPVASLLRWAATERAVVANDEPDSALVIAGPVGRGGSFLGVLVLYAADRHRHTREKLRPWLGRYASHLALLLELVDDARSARRYRQRAQAFLQAAQRIQHNLDLPELGSEVCEAAIEVSAASRAAFVLWDEGAVEGVVHAVSAGHPLTPGMLVTRDSIVAEWCREQRRFPMPHADRMAPGRPVYGTAEPLRRIGSFGIVPVLSGRRTVGAIVVEGDLPAQIGSVETETLQLLAAPTAVALDNTVRYSQAEETARIDALTGLGNRRAFDERLSQLLGASDRYGQLVSLVLVDMDHFKQINDTCGHDAGDMVLRLAAKALERTVRETDFCARYGGEELAILMSRTGLAEAAEAAERVRRAIEQIQVDVSGRGLLVTASLGVACYPESTPTRETFFAAADRALYEAKTAGRNCVKLASANATLPIS